MQTKKQIQVVLVDDHQLVLQGIAHLIESESGMTVIGTAENDDELQNLMERCKPDVVLLDINLPGLNGVEICRRLKQDFPDLAVLCLSMNKEPSIIKLVLKCGANGYLMKNVGKTELIEAIRTVAEGSRYLSAECIDLLAGLTEPEQAVAIPVLSRREKEVLELIVKEYTTREIADKLFISFSTVETHRQHLLTKLGARNTAGLVRFAFEYGLTKSLG